MDRKGAPVMQIGRIENEPDSVYFGPSDKPKFGSTAIRQYIIDPEMFYLLHIAKTMPEPDFPQAAFGHALEEALLENRCRYITSGVKTPTAKAHLESVAANPDKHVLTDPQFASLQSMVDAGLNDAGLMAAVGHGLTQVTYRVDMGPFYLQARLDLEVDLKDAPEAVYELYRVNQEAGDKLIIDLKKTRTHYGKDAFRNAAIRQWHYPLQQALYKLVVGKVTDTNPDKIPFRFHAISEMECESKAYDLMDIYDVAGGKVADAIASLEYRLRLNDWADFQQECQQVLIPEGYLQWV